MCLNRKQFESELKISKAVKFIKTNKINKTIANVISMVIETALY